MSSLGMRMCVTDATSWIALLLVVACIFGVSGCGGGGQPASVSGQVTFAGEPVENGALRFDGIGETTSTPASAKIQGGRYEIPASAGLQAGTYRVSISATESAGKKVDPESGEEVEAVRNLLPEKYSVGSELTAELSSGANTIDFDLQP